jgi:hypothetical protein
MTWGKRGLIPNTKVIKSYHPPSIDNITGVAISTPATLFKTENIDDPLKVKFKSIDELPSAAYSGSNVTDFNINDIPAGPDTNLSHNAPVYGKYYKDAALSSDDESVYRKNVEQLNIPTIADRMTSGLENKPVKITDNFSDAQTFYKIPPLVKEQKDSEGKTPLDTRKPIPRRYDLIPTKVPCAIPGVINCYMEIYDNIDVTQPNYTYSLPNVEMYYRPHRERTNIEGKEYPNMNTLYIHMATDFTDITPLSDSDPGDE